VLGLEEVVNEMGGLLDDERDEERRQEQAYRTTPRVGAAGRHLHIPIPGSPSICKLKS